MNEWNDDDLFNLFELVYDLGQFTKMIMGLHVVGYSLYTEYNLEKQISILSKIESGKRSLLFESLGWSPLQSLKSPMNV